MSLIYVDESKVKGYTMVTTNIDSRFKNATEKTLRAQLLPGQRRIHFTKESPARRRHFLSKLEKLDFQANVFHCATKNHAHGRHACLVALIDHAAKVGCTRISFEREASVEAADRRTLFSELKKHGLASSLAYSFEEPHREPLLWVSDAIAWCYTKGGDWRRRVTPLISGITEV